LNSIVPQFKGSEELQLPASLETAIILVDRCGIILFANQAFTNMTGYTSQELCGKKINEIRSAVNPEGQYEDLWNTVSSGNVWSGEISNKTKDGKLITVLTTITPVKNAEGEITHYIGTKVDIKAKEMHKRNLAEMHRLSQLGRISGSLLHELKSHYALIKMNLDQMDPNSQEDINNYKIIKKDLEKLNRYFQNVLRYLREMEFNMTNVNLKEAVAHCFSFVSPMFAEKAIQVENRVDAEVIKADYQQVLSVFKNLILNSAESIDGNGKIEAWSSKVNGSVKLYFKDNGTGISNPDRIFEPFYSTKAAGSGLGLTISLRIMKKHKGSIKLIKSQKGETVFELIFPGMEHEQNSNN
jgi:PAS domain S-box-containing protein